MSEQISTVVDDDVNHLIEALAEHHDISKSAAIRLLIYEGLQARELRFRYEALDAKLDVLLESLGGEPPARKTVRDRYETVMERGLPDSTLTADLNDTPLPHLRNAGSLPDTSDVEAALNEDLLDERDDINDDSTVHTS